MESVQTSFDIETKSHIAAVITETLQKGGLEVSITEFGNQIIVDALSPQPKDRDLRNSNFARALTYTVQDNGVAGPGPSEFGKRKIDAMSQRVEEELACRGLTYDNSTGMYVGEFK